MSKPRAGYLSLPVTLGSSESIGIFNEAGLDLDFRVESSINEYGLFLDGTDGNVGINESSPSATLDVNGDVKISGSLIADGSTGTSGQVLSSTGTGLQWITNSSSGGGDTLDFEGGVVINDNGNSVDFRVESITNENMLFVDGSEDRVGINTSTPATDFDVNGDVKISGSLNAGGSVGTSGQVLTSTGTGISWADASSGGGADFEGGVVINDDAADVDFRVEGVGQENALFVQGSDGNVGVRTNAPAYPMHLYMAASGTTAESDYDDLVIESDNRAGITVATPYNRFASLQLRNSSSSRYTIKMGFNQATHSIHNSNLLQLHDTNGVVVNETGNSVDFRVESDLRTHALFLQGSDGAIGINTNVPAADLDVNGNVKISGGLLMGSPTGGDKGAGTINATAVYDDNTLLTDFVLDQAVDGEIDYEFYDSLELGGSAARDWDPRNLDIDFYEAQWRERRSLPAFMTKEERLDSDGNEIRDSIGKLVQGLQQELETAHVHIAQLNKRLKELEEKL